MKTDGDKVKHELKIGNKLFQEILRLVEFINTQISEN